MTDLPFPEATGPDVDAENDPSIIDLETVCASCGMPHWKPGMVRDCLCARHIDSPGETRCNAARIDAND
jgi:hypothetical protein